MEILILMTYAAICVVIFKFFRIPVNKWTVPTAVLGGAVILGILIFTMNYNHPFSRNVRQIYFVTPLIPEVRARVKEIPAQPNVMVNEGSPLILLDDTRYRARVEQLEAQLADTGQDVAGLVDSVGLARANLASSESNLDQAVQTLRRYQRAPNAISKDQLTTQQDIVKASQGERDAAKAALEQTETQLSGSIDGKDPALAAIDAQLKEARFNLDSTIIRAPTDGYVTQLGVRPGMMALPLPLKPLANFVHKQNGRIIAGYRQTSLLRLQVGYKAELAFTAMPGKVFPATVTSVLPIIAGSEFQAGGSLLGAEGFERLDDTVLVELTVEDPSILVDLPMGITAQAAVYSDHMEGLALLRKILLRMMSWQHYLYLDD